MELQKKIYKLVKKTPGITMSTLERRVGINPSSLKEHCKILEYWSIIKIKKTEKTTQLFISLENRN